MKTLADDENPLLMFLESRTQNFVQLLKFFFPFFLIKGLLPTFIFFWWLLLAIQGALPLEPPNSSSRRDLISVFAVVIFKAFLFCLPR